MSKDITTTLFKIVKDAEPTILLTGISLAIGALGFSREGFTNFTYSIISSFMFIFSFVFYLSYELFKKFIVNENNRMIEIREKMITNKSDYDIYHNNIVFVKNSLQMAPIFYFFMGIIFLILIAYEFSYNSLDLTQLKVENNN